MGNKHLLTTVVRRLFLRRRRFRLRRCGVQKWDSNSRFTPGARECASMRILARTLIWEKTALRISNLQIRIRTKKR